MKASRRVLFTAHTQKWHEKELLSFLDKMRAMMCDARWVFFLNFVSAGTPSKSGTLKYSPTGLSCDGSSIQVRQQGNETSLLPCCLLLQIDPQAGLQLQIYANGAPRAGQHQIQVLLFPKRPASENRKEQKEKGNNVHYLHQLSQTRNKIGEMNG